MKTIKDAYEELKGDLGNSYKFLNNDCYLFFNDLKDIYICDTVGYQKSPDYQYICTVEEFNNYKGDDVKSVLDAVIEYEGDWSNAKYGDVDVKFIFASKGEGSTWPKGALGGDSENHSPNAFYEVCNHDEFNTLVDELASNMGRSDKSYAEYKNTFNSVDKVGCFDGSYGGEVKYNAIEFHDEEAKPVVVFAAQDLTISTAKHVYTQAMCDAGEFPGVGMECKFETTFFTTVTSNRGTCEIIAYYNGKVWINIIDFECVINLDVIDFMPLTPPIELIDGKAYQFDYTGLARMGFYDSRRDMFEMASCNWPVEACTNTKPLTVEGE